MLNKPSEEFVPPKYGEIIIKDGAQNVTQKRR